MIKIRGGRDHVRRASLIREKLAQARAVGLDLVHVLRAEEADLEAGAEVVLALGDDAREVEIIFILEAAIVACALEAEAVGDEIAVVRLKQTNARVVRRRHPKIDASMFLPIDGRVLGKALYVYFVKWHF